LVNLVERLSRFLPAGRRSDASIVQEQFRTKVGYPLDLANPRGLHEKICWLRLNRSTPLHTWCADKVTAPGYVTSRLGPGFVAECYLVTQDPADLHPGNIRAAACVVKSSHDSGGFALVPDTAAADWPEIRQRLGARLKRNHYTAARERQYKDIVPRLLVEELLVSPDGTPVQEVKMFCLNGRVAMIRHCPGDPKSETALWSIRDPDWTKRDVRFKLKTCWEGDAPRPARLEEMKAAAEHLAEPFAFVRVDFLLAGDRFYVGELTFTPTAGYDTLLPHSYELELGSGLDHLASVPDWRPHLAAAQALDGA
jgi:hypothetical protein